MKVTLKNTCISRMTRNQLIDIRCTVQELLNKYNLPVLYYPFKEWAKLENKSFQMFGATNYEQCQNWPEEKVKNTVLNNDWSYQLMGMTNGGKVPHYLAVSGRRGGYCAAFILPETLTP